MQELSPDFLLKRITPDEAAAGLVRGIEERAPRVFVPKWWRYVSAFRGLINPLLDRRMEKDEKTVALLRDLDAKTVDAGEAPAELDVDCRAPLLVDGALHMVVERLRGDVRFVRPLDRDAELVDPQLAKEIDVPQGLEDAPVLPADTTDPRPPRARPQSRRWTR